MAMEACSSSSSSFCSSSSSSSSLSKFACRHPKTTSALAAAGLAFFSCPLTLPLLVLSSPLLLLLLTSCVSLGLIRLKPPQASFLCRSDPPPTASQISLRSFAYTFFTQSFFPNSHPHPHHHHSTVALPISAMDLEEEEPLPCSFSYVSMGENGVGEVYFPVFELGLSFDETRIEPL